MRIYVKDLKNYIGQQVELKGFAETIRNQGSIKFILLRDVTGLIQCVVLKSDQQAFEAADSLSIESVISIKGLVKEEKQAPGGFEVQAQEIIVLSKSDPELPIPVLFEKSGNETEISKRLDYRWVDLRKDEKLLIFKTWTVLEQGFRKCFEKHDFIQIYTPSLMSAASESGAEVFTVDYFGKKAFLAQSPQFYKQMAMASGFERVFTFAPVFRAEPSFTSRHLTEFTGWDFEMSYINSHEEVMDFEEELIISGFELLKEKLGLDIEIPLRPFPRITMKEAKEKLSKAGVKGERPFDINGEEETKLGEIIKEETGSDFVFLTEYPFEARPFYHMKKEDDESLTKSFDLLYKGLEITTGAQREHRYDVLVDQAQQKKINPESVKDYLSFFKYGCPPHGGAGIGPARMIMKILNLPSVKEATFLPRDVKRLTP